MFSSNHRLHYSAKVPSTLTTASTLALNHRLIILPVARASEVAGVAATRIKLKRGLRRLGLARFKLIASESAR